MPTPAPLLSGDDSFFRRIATALAEFDRPCAICVAATVPRVEFVRDIVRRSGELPPGQVDAVLAHEAAAAIEANCFQLVVLDVSVDVAARADLSLRAKRRFPNCKVLEITAWSSDAPL